MSSGGASSGSSAAAVTQPPAGSGVALVPWQDELLATVLGVDVRGTRGAPSSAAAASASSGPQRLIPLDQLIEPSSIKSATALTDPGSQLLDAVLFAVLTLPSSSRGGLTPLGYLLTCHSRMDATTDVSAWCCYPALLLLRQVGY